MLDRRVALAGAVALSAGIVAPRGALANAARMIEIRVRIDLPATLGGIRVAVPAAGVSFRGDADRFERSGATLTAVWKGGALAPWIETTRRLVLPAGAPIPSRSDVAAPWIETVAGPLDARLFSCVVTIREVAA